MLIFKTVVVHDHETALIYKNGHLIDTVGAGKYRLWGRHRRAVVFDRRRQSVTIPGQEILTKDHVPIRLTLAVTYQVDDPFKAYHEVVNYVEQLYLDLQLALRQQVSELTFDELLEQKGQLGETLHVAVHEAAAAYGLQLHRTGVKDVTMPGNVREVMLKKVEAEKSAQASLIRAREEVAAARARANVAKLISENPAVLRLKELEAMSEMAKSPGNTIVFAARSDVDGLISPAGNGNGNGK